MNLAKSSRKLLLILANISFIIFSYSIWEMKYVVVNADSFLGLASQLPLIYWIGLGLVVFCVSIFSFDAEQNHKFDFIFILLIFSLYLFGLGIFIEENSRMPWSYYPLGEIRLLLETHHIDITSPYPLISYRSWPSFQILSFFIHSISGVDLIYIPKYMPIFWIISFIFITFAIGLRMGFSYNNCLLLSSLALSSFIVPQYYYSPQSFAILLYLALFMVISKHNIQSRDIILSILLFVGLITGHLLTSIVSILAISFIIIYKKEHRYITLFIILFILWYIYISPHVFSIGIQKLIDMSTTYSGFLILSSNKFLPLTEAKWLLNLIRFAYPAILILSTTVIILRYLYNHKAGNKSSFFFCIMWIIGVMSTAPLKYGPEGLERVYLFCLIPAIFILISNVRNKKFLTLLLIFLTFMHIPAHYGDESYVMSHTTDLMGSQHFALKIQPDNTYFYAFYPYVQYNDPRLILIPYLYFRSNELPDYALLIKSEFIINSKQSSNRMIFFFGEDYVNKWLKANQSIMNKNYDSGEFEINVRRR